MGGFSWRSLCSTYFQYPKLDSDGLRDRLRFSEDGFEQWHGVSKRGRAAKSTARRAFGPSSPTSMQFTYVSEDKVLVPLHGVEREHATDVSIHRLHL